MANVSVNFGSPIGAIKPMHAVNNGPIHASKKEQSRGNFDTFKAAKIPYVRTHDSSFCPLYGGEHSVDIHAVFPDFTKNPRDPDSYDFTLTDDYIQSIVDSGAEVFYRLGTKIEHWRKKYGTVVPADFNKWAVICEYIIRHYNEGWANGFHHNIRYWEIWNEPDGAPNWTGSPEEFYEMYEIAATHLKKRFPHLKIGGPAISCVPKDGGRWTKNFLKHLTADGKRVPLDFLSWHLYTRDPREMLVFERIARTYLRDAGYTETESILNEYNYLENWTDLYISTIESIISMRGAAFTSACFSLGQASSVDMLMYYDAQPCVWNGMFDYYTLRPLKGYYPFIMFSYLYELGNYSECGSDNEDVYVIAAENGEERAVMLTHYRADKQKTEKTVTLKLSGVPDGIWQAELLDDENTMTVKALTVKDGMLSVTMPSDCVIFLKNKYPEGVAQ